MKLVKELQNRYWVSHKGYLVNRKMKRRLYGNPRTNGYLSICALDLENNNTPKRVQVHTIVAKYFVPNPHNYPIVMHLDDNKNNNHYKNLKWATYEMNTQDMMSKGRHNNQHTTKKLKNG